MGRKYIIAWSSRVALFDFPTKRSQVAATAIQFQKFNLENESLADRLFAWIWMI